MTKIYWANGPMVRRASVTSFFLAVSSLSLADAAPTRDASFDYAMPEQGGFVEGVIFSEWEVACGFTTQPQISDIGYLSIFKRAYWLLGSPYESWNFDIRTDYPDDTDVKVSFLIDGHDIDYPEKITIGAGLASSRSDICHDGGYCPKQVNAEVLRGVGRELQSAKSLEFRVSSKDKTEKFAMRADFRLVVTEIDACIGRLLMKTTRSEP